MYTRASAEEETLLLLAVVLSYQYVFTQSDALQTMSPPSLADITLNDVDHVARVQTYLKRVERDCEKHFSYYKKRDSQTRVWLNLIKDIRSVN